MYTTSIVEAIKIYFLVCHPYGHIKIFNYKKTWWQWTKWPEHLFTTMLMFHIFQRALGWGQQGTVRTTSKLEAWWVEATLGNDKAVSLGIRWTWVSLLAGYFSLGDLMPGHGFFILNMGKSLLSSEGLVRLHYVSECMPTNMVGAW